MTEALFQRFRDEGFRLKKDSVPAEHDTEATPPMPTQATGINSWSHDEQPVPSTSGAHLHYVPDAVSPSALGSTTFIRHSLPLGYHVSDKIKHQIWGDVYVDLASLLPSSQTTSDTVLYSFGSTSLKLTEAKPKRVASTQQWCNAFDIFMSLCIMKDANCALPLIKYTNNIRRMIGEFGFDAASFYDEEFRRVKPSHNLDWTVIHDELWRQAMSLSKQGNFRA